MTGLTVKVVVLDLDGTLIGDVSMILTEYNIISKLTSEATAKRQTSKTLIDAMEYGNLLRQGVKRMLHTPGLEFFVYTASETQWAEMVIKALEKTTGARINRPLFTRKDCIVTQDMAVKKSLSFIKNRILLALKKKFKQNVNLEDRVVFVDNTPNVLLDQREMVYQVTCPTYKHIHVHDVVSNLSSKQIAMNKEYISRLLGFQGNQGSADHFTYMYYSYLRHHAMKNKPTGKDLFFQKLTSKLCGFDKFTTQNIHACR